MALSLEEFGVELATAINLRLHQPTVFFHAGALLTLGDGERALQVDVERFYHDHTVAETVDRVAEIWDQFFHPKPLVWDAIRDNIIPHIVGMPSSTPYWLLDTLSPFIALAISVNSEKFVRFLVPANRQELAVSDEDLARQLVVNLRRIAQAHPGTSETTTSGVAVTVFEGDLAADRAFALMKDSEQAAVAWVSSEFALVAPSLKPEALQELAMMAAIAHAAGKAKPHPLAPVVHLFEHGVMRGLAKAIPAL